jgi:hypothetical protein
MWYNIEILLDTNTYTAFQGNQNEAISIIQSDIYSIPS